MVECLDYFLLLTIIIALHQILPTHRTIAANALQTQHCDTDRY